MKVFTAEHDGVWLGGYSVIVAENEAEALDLLKAELIKQHLSLKWIEVKELDTSAKGAVVLFDGDY